jgi:hypothetical protein
VAEVGRWGLRRRDVNRTHGMSNTKIYKLWTDIKRRCYNKNRVGYKNYGGRGIRVSEEWKNSFEAFFEWAMENGYKEGLEIDRIDNDGDYCPSNCRFVTDYVQDRNKRTNRKYNFNSAQMCITDLSKIAGISRDVIIKRIEKKGMRVENALTEATKGHITEYTIGDETHSIIEWCRIMKISYEVVKNRLLRGMYISEALIKPLKRTFKKKKKVNSQ